MEALEFDRQGSFQEFARNVGWDTRDKILKKHVAANCELVPIDLNLQLIFLKIDLKDATIFAVQSILGFHVNYVSITIDGG